MHLVFSAEIFWLKKSPELGTPNFLISEQFQEEKVCNIERLVLGLQPERPFTRVSEPSSPESLKKSQKEPFRGSTQNRERKNYLPPPPESKIELWTSKSTVDIQILENTGKSYLP